MVHIHDASHVHLLDVQVKLLNGMEIAVERLFVNNRRDIEEFLNEVVSMNGVKLKRHCPTKRRKLLVYEYVENHDLLKKLFGKLQPKSNIQFTHQCQQSSLMLLFYAIFFQISFDILDMF